MATGTVGLEHKPRNPLDDAKGPELYGVIAEFDDSQELMAAAEKVRDQGFRRWDCHTPFPVHGLDQAMGIGMTILPVIVFFIGLGGLAVALLMQWWMNGLDYQFIISNKPNESPWRMLPAMVPIMFELMVLFSAFGAVATMLGLNQLPQFYHPLFNVERFSRATNDRFFISIEAKDPQFDLEKTEKFLGSLGGLAVERVPLHPTNGTSELENLHSSLQGSGRA